MSTRNPKSLFLTALGHVCKEGHREYLLMQNTHCRLIVAPCQNYDPFPPGGWMGLTITFGDVEATATNAFFNRLTSILSKLTS